MIFRESNNRIKVQKGLNFSWRMVNWTRHIVECIDQPNSNGSPLYLMEIFLLFCLRKILFLTSLKHWKLSKQKEEFVSTFRNYIHLVWLTMFWRLPVPCPCLALPLPYPALPGPALPCPGYCLPCPALPCPALALPCPALPCPGPETGGPKGPLEETLDDPLRVPSEDPLFFCWSGNCF